MLIGNNATSLLFGSDYARQNSRLQTSMARLSSGSRLLTPGEGPADLGISERFRAQVRNSDEAGRVIQNALNLFQTSDTYMQQVHDMLGRMSELAIAAADGSKSQADRKNLDLEFQQLKTEVARISEAGKYNGLQINSSTAVAVYDTHNHVIKYSQADGSDLRTLDVNFQAGNTSDNGIDYAFESAATAQNIGDFVFTEDGKSLVYIAQKSAATGSLSARKTLMKLDLESNTIATVQLTSAGGAHAGKQARLIQDSEGRIWVSDPSTVADSAKKQFNVKLLNVDSMSLDAGGTAATNKWAGGVSLASSFSNFAVHEDYIYYIERSAGGAPLRYVKQSIYDQTDKSILVNDLSGAAGFDLDPGETYAISQDGQYLAYEDADSANTGTMVVINTQTGEKASIRVGNRTTSIVALDFDANNNIYWTDTGTGNDENAVKRAKILFGDKPEITDIETVQNGTAGKFGAYNSAVAGTNAMGLSVGTGSPATEYKFQVGPDQGMDVKYRTADVTLTNLGISNLDVSTEAHARSAIGSLEKAVDLVANTRAVIGSQVSRLNFVFSANEGYKNNIAAAESRIRDVDIAAETTTMAKAQIATQTALSVLAQANSNMQNVLRLLQ